MIVTYSLDDRTSFRFPPFRTYEDAGSTVEMLVKVFRDTHHDVDPRTPVFEAEGFKEFAESQEVAELVEALGKLKTL